MIRIQLALITVCSLLIPAAFAEEKLKVVTTFTVLADMTRQVAGEKADVVSLTKPGAEIHGYQPTPQDMVAASGADVIFWNGLNLEVWFRQFLENLGSNIPSVTLSDGIDAIPILSGAYEGKPNPHAWMSLANARRYVGRISEALGQHDPDNRQTYQRNAEAYIKELDSAIAPLRARLASLPANKRWLVTCEGAFSYLARDADLNELYLWAMNADEVGTPRQISRVIDAVREHDIDVVFCESTVNTAPARQVARETGARYGGELYVDSLSEPDGPVPSYLELLRVTMRTLADGLGPEEH